MLESAGDLVALSVGLMVLWLLLGMLASGHHTRPARRPRRRKAPAASAKRTISPRLPLKPTLP